MKDFFEVLKPVPALFERARKDKPLLTLIQFTGWFIVVLTGFCFLYWKTWLDVTHSPYPWPSDRLSFLYFLWNLVRSVNQFGIFFIYPVYGSLMLIGTKRGTIPKKIGQPISGILRVLVIGLAQYLVYILCSKSIAVLIVSVGSLGCYFTVKNTMSLATLKYWPTKGQTGGAPSTQNSSGQAANTDPSLGRRIFLLCVSAVYFVIAAGLVAGALYTIDGVQQSVKNVNRSSSPY